MPTPTRSYLTPPLIGALVLSAVLVVGIAVAGIMVGSGLGAATEPVLPPNTSTGPVSLVPVDSPQADSAGCAALLRALPATLANGKAPLHSRGVAATSVPQSAMAWGAGDSPVVLRCGIERPAELTQTSELLGVSGVQWFEVTGDDAATWYAVDRAAVVALTLPDGVNTGPIQDVSTAIRVAMPAAVPVF
jgi:hypothetical protein